MNRRDQGILGALLVAFAAVSIAIAVQPSDTASPGSATAPLGSANGTESPGSSPAATDAAGQSTAEPSASDGLAALPAIRQGIIGHPESINPLTARTQADRDLVALVYSGLVKLGPDDTVVPDLAKSWTVDKTGRIWTFRIRSDATWQDGVPVTAEDVTFTIGLLRDPAYTGPDAASWAEVTPSRINDLTVRFTLKTALGGFLLAARQPLLPVHLLRGIAVADLADSPFSSAPVGSGPYRLLQWHSDAASLEPTGSSPSAVSSAAPAASSSAPAAAASSPPAIIRLELRFYDTAEALADAYRAGDVDMAEGLPPAISTSLATTPGARLVRQPRATLTAIAFNLRPNRPALRDENVRQALLKAINRVKLVEDVLGGLGRRADTLIPPQSWAYVAAAAKPVEYSTQHAATQLRAAGWKKTGGAWYAPKATKPFVMELITPDKVWNPIAYGTAQSVAMSWRAFGLTVKVVALAPTAFVDDRLATANFTAAVVDVNVGLDPDLYPLLASQQVRTGGSNITGVQSLVLDEKLVAARKPGTLAERRKAYADLQRFLATSQVMLPLFFRDDTTVVSQHVLGTRIRLLGDASDRFWDVLTWRLANGQ